MMMEITSAFPFFLRPAAGRVDDDQKRCFRRSHAKSGRRGPQRGDPPASGTRRERERDGCYKQDSIILDSSL